MAARRTAAKTARRARKGRPVRVRVRMAPMLHARSKHARRDRRKPNTLHRARRKAVVHRHHYRRIGIIDKNTRARRKTVRAQSAKAVKAAPKWSVNRPAPITPASYLQMF
ncbi:hypothetical protein SCMU_13860 [Sinomonas cyclohexanicum]|uniref:Uncharacterized protein n=2 Tax=Sinomonas cyclohexanicum TaxID=322009 RepID=A0ABN6FFX5_SINCY|nr:hypothetical protein SCMU_13860 [Corynebacterium cyclohexanicum]